MIKRIALENINLEGRKVCDLMNNSMKVSKLRKCGTIRGVVGVSLIFLGIANLSLLSVIVGTALVFWSLHSVACLESEVNHVG